MGRGKTSMIAIHNASSETDPAQNPYRWPYREEELWCHTRRYYRKRRANRSMANSSQMVSPASWLGPDVKTYAYPPGFVSKIVLRTGQLEASSGNTC